MTNSAELLPCPWCQGQAQIDITSWLWFAKLFKGHCTRCGLYAPGDWLKDWEAAVNQWNERGANADISHSARRNE